MAYAVMLTRQRSGSGALGQALATCAGLTYCDEVLLPQGAFRPSSFYKFCAGAGPIQSADDFCGAFVRYLEGQAAAEPIGILDVKAAQLRAFAPSYWPAHEPPWILHALLIRRPRIIRLKRRNLVDQWLSGLLALANQMWHAESDVEVPIRRVRVIRSEVEHFISLCAREDALIDAVLVGHDVVEVEYEALFGPGRDGPDQEECRRITAFLGVGCEYHNFRTPYIKQTPWNLIEKIENYEEIADLAEAFASPGGAEKSTISATMTLS